jgi:gliding motility-associated-like protein
MLIGSVAAAPPSTVATFTDNTAQTELYSYYYKMVAVDSCGDDAMTSNIGRTILATAVANDEMTNTVYWNDYEVWGGNVLHYNIYRQTDGVWDPNIAATIPYAGVGQNLYVDDVSANINYVGKFAYRIEAIEAPGNPFAFADTSWSNIAEVAQKPLVFVPSAFTPNGNGLNDQFIPSVGFIDIEDYTFQVFNRWGEMLFESNDRYLGWDGRYQGNKSPPGVYVYLLTFKTASGQYIDKKGTVTLIR